MKQPHKISLRNLDIIISYREANEERRENLYTVLRHLQRTYDDYKLWLLEADVQPRFDWSRLSEPKIRHVFIPHAGAFPKSMLYNIGAKLAQNPVICFHDADSIAKPEAFVFCLTTLLDNNDSDVLHPYKGVVNVNGQLKETFTTDPDYGIFESITPNDLPKDVNMLYPEANGGILFFRRKDYIRVGGYNARLEGWGGEDNEMLTRSVRLGVRWHSLVAPLLIHLHHDADNRDEWLASVRGGVNDKTATAAVEMPLEEIEALSRELSAFFTTSTV